MQKKILSALLPLILCFTLILPGCSADGQTAAPDRSVLPESLQSLSLRNIWISASATGISRKW